MSPEESIKKIKDIIVNIFATIATIGMIFIGIVSILSIPSNINHYETGEGQIITEGVITKKEVKLVRTTPPGGNTLPTYNEHLFINLNSIDTTLDYNKHRIKYELLKERLKEGMEVKITHTSQGSIEAVEANNEWLLTWEEVKGEQKMSPLFLFFMGIILISIGIAPHWKWIKKMRATTSD